MHRRTACTIALFFTLTHTAGAQHGGAAPPVRTTPAEARQFAFLIGDFDLVVKPAAKGLAQKIHGVPKLVGTWKGARALDGFGLVDELRITDASGNPKAFVHAVRYYDAAVHHWIASSIDVYRGTFTPSTAEWRDNAMTATSQGIDAEGKAYQTRSRYFDITPTGFRFQQDRSADGGKTWDEATLVIEARKVAGAAPRS